MHRLVQCSKLTQKKTLNKKIHLFLNLFKDLGKSLDKYPKGHKRAGKLIDWNSRTNRKVAFWTKDCSLKGRNLESYDPFESTCRTSWKYNLPVAEWTQWSECTKVVFKISVNT